MSKIRTKDTNGRPYAKLSRLKSGDRVETDEGFTCMGAVTRIVREDAVGKYIACSQGQHYLDGQLEGKDTLIGIYHLK